ncbi:hypothetical protein DH2020_048377 [Rehmannia glutinosa]|uniref:cellulase n=1 Tax=Rehmannia glutinosa TaxID=99300 RepID=A0ABR0U5T0_REHGL
MLSESSKRDTKRVLHDYGDALSKSILFFEGQRSGKLPSTQRLTWRKDSALGDGFDKGVIQLPNDILNNNVGVGVLEYGKTMGRAADAVAGGRPMVDGLFPQIHRHKRRRFCSVGDPIGRSQLLAKAKIWTLLGCFMRLRRMLRIESCGGDGGGGGGFFGVQGFWG